MKYQIVSYKPLVIFLLIIVLGAGGFFAWKKFKNRPGAEESQPAVYEALVNIVDQKGAGSPEEDLRANLKKGDVIAYFPEGHQWSDTERASYLIVKIKLLPEDAAKLLEAETKEVKREKREGEESGRPETEQETVRARKYFLDLPDFDTQKFWGGGGQPFSDKIFDEDIIEEK